MKIRINKKRTLILLCIIVEMNFIVGCSKIENKIVTQDKEVMNQYRYEPNEKLVEAILKEIEFEKNNNRYTFFNVNLKGMQSENEVIAYIWGDDFESTEVGTMMIFENVNGEYNCISKCEKVNFPMYIIQNQSNGFYDLVVTSSIEGASSKNVVLKYENGQYTLDSSTVKGVNVDDFVILRTLQYEVKSDGGFELK